MESLKWGTRESAILFYTEAGRYTDALNLLSSLDRPLEPRLLLAKCTCLYNKGMIAQAIEGVKEAEDQEWDLPDFLMIKGKCLYRINEFESAKGAFERCDAMFPTPEVKRWVQRCITRIAANSDEVMSRRVIRYEPDLTQIMPQAVKHEYYQSPTHLTLCLFVQGVKKDELVHTFGRDSIDLVIERVPRMEFHAHLAKEIEPEETKVTFTQKKVEIKMKKASNSVGQWQDIEVSAP